MLTYVDWKKIFFGAFSLFDAGLQELQYVMKNKVKYTLGISDLYVIYKNRYIYCEKTNHTWDTSIYNYTQNVSSFLEHSEWQNLYIYIYIYICI